MLAGREDTLSGKNVLISGSGNVAQFAAEKCISHGAKVLTMSDSEGFIYDPSGIDQEKLEFIKELKNERRGRISEYAAHFGCEYHAGEKPWKIKCDIALPNATQNEVALSDAEALISN